MEKLNLNELQKEFNCKSDYQKLMLSELIRLVVVEPSNKTGYTSERNFELLKALFGDKANSDEVVVLGLAGYWSNDLALIFGDSVGIGLGIESSEVFNKIFDAISGKEIISGVVFNK